MSEESKQRDIIIDWLGGIKKRLTRKSKKNKGSVIDGLPTRGKYEGLYPRGDKRLRYNVPIKYLDRKDPVDREILKSIAPMNYTVPEWIEDRSHYNDKNWFSKFSIRENGTLLPDFTWEDVKNLSKNMPRKSAVYEALKNFKIGKYGLSDLGRSLYDGVEKIGDGILYFPRRYLENERRENREWEEIYCGFTPRMFKYMRAKREERETQRKQAKAQAGMAPLITSGGGMLLYQPEIATLNMYQTPGTYTIEFREINTNNAN